MKKYLVFTSNNARIVSADKPDQLRTPYVESWDRAALKGHYLHHWKYVDGRVVPMSAEEKAARDKDIAAFGVDNRVFIEEVKTTAQTAQKVMVRKSHKLPKRFIALGFVAIAIQIFILLWVIRGCSC